MKLIGLTAFGGPEVLAAHDVAEPHAGPGQVRIRVRAAAVSPTDTGVRTGGYGGPEPTEPLAPGMDAAGVIDEVGDPADGLDTSAWSVGDEVMAMALPSGEHGGAYVEYLVADADSLSRVPEGVSLEEASTLPMNALTALQALDRLDLPEGGVFAVTGAAGTLGVYAVALAKRRGLTVIAEAAGKDRERVLAAGADHVVPRGDDVAERIREIAPDGVDGLLDAAVQNDAALPAVRAGGGFATVRGWDAPEDADVTLHKIFVFDDYHHAGKLDDVVAAVESGRLVPDYGRSMPAEEAPEAHRLLEAGGQRGRIVLTF